MIKFGHLFIGNTENLKSMNGVHKKIHALREILLVVLTKKSQLYIFSKRYQKFCKTYQYFKVDGTKYATKFFFVKLIKFK